MDIPYIAGLVDKPVTDIVEKLVGTGAKIDISCNNWPDQYPDRRPTTVYAGHGDGNLYLHFDCHGPHLKALVDRNLGPVADDSCVEFFVMPHKPGWPDGAAAVDEGRYWNFEFNAIGRINASHRLTRPEPTRLTPAELDAIKTYPSAGREPFDEMDGDRDWTLTVVIPTQLFGVKAVDRPLPLWVNFYKCGAKTSSPHYLSWAPIRADRPDFHRPDSFAKVTLNP